MEVLPKHSSVPLNSEIAFCVYIARIVSIPRYTLRFVLSEESILPVCFAIALHFTLQSLCISLCSQTLVEILEGQARLNTQFFLEDFLTGLILAQRSASFALAQIAAYEPIVGFFQAVIEEQHVAPVLGALAPGFSVPGKFCELAARLQVGSAQFIAPERAPVVVERPPVIAPVERDQFEEGFSGTRLILPG